ncbi:MAG: TIGR02646 family protein [Symplocastrum torsivum CPER-KK1]|uniref:TIGR02646 family protein n=1 Tax=Symplocastrum torsivum CPER-KK1 TaxID=450513 RepID=A0A951U897_9CYAN|nr:TIGR02646 family protein [Symplocastrum torsivum CPER-KK1]
MRYIRKGDEPESFTAWKERQKNRGNPLTWKAFRRRVTVKNDVYDALLWEQGYVCCYCGMQITRDTSHFEHFKPKSNITYAHQVLDYRNLLVSCKGESEDSEESEEEHRVPVHCGHKKDKWYDEQLMVSPLDVNCASFFRYSASGEILPTDEPDKQEAAKTTIEKLGLDIEKLRLIRSAAIDGALLAIEGLTDEEIQRFSQDFEQLNDQGKYQPFCFAIAYILKQYFVT